MSTEPLLRTEDTDDAGPSGADLGVKKKLEGLQKDLQGVLAMSKADWIATGMQQKNWGWLFLYLLALIVLLIFMYHEAEGSTPLLTVVSAFISIFGLMAAGYQIYLAAKLEEQIEKFQAQNALLEGNNRKMTTQLGKFEQLRENLEKFSAGQGEKFEETFKNVSEMFGNVKKALEDQRGVLHDQRQETMTKVFFDFAFRDGDETMNAMEYKQASHAIPKYLKEAWNKYTFETFPRGDGRSSSEDITMDDFTAALEEMMKEQKEESNSNDIV